MKDYCADDSVTDYLGSAALLNISFFELPMRRPVKVTRRMWGMVDLDSVQFLSPALSVAEEEDFDAPLSPVAVPDDDDELDDDDDELEDDEDEDDDDEFGDDLDDDDDDDPEDDDEGVTARLAILAMD